MSRKLLVLRHAKSDWSIDTSDFNRPLKRRGKRAAQRMGSWLRQQDLIPDYILASPAERARNTAEKLTKAMGLTAQHVYYDDRLYACDLDTLKAVLTDIPSAAKQVLLVGHSPDLEELLEYLNKKKLSREEDGKLLPTATLAILEMPNDWGSLSKGCAEVKSITRPASLPTSFPFNGLNGLEQRKRPSYYYSQSAAIPYRIKAGNVQILVISSSGNNHWGIPKGIIEPGQTASSSAAIEAWEEAGITGIVSEHLFDYYHHQKWGGTCTVQVYPMIVTEMVSDEEWEESHRSRQWLSVKKACSLIKNKSLQDIIAQFAANIADKKD